MFIQRCFRTTNFAVNIFILLVLLFMLAGQAFGQNEELSVIKGWMKYSDVQNSLYHHLSSQLISFLDLRSSAIEKLHSKADWLDRQNQVRETLNNIVGPFPQKTPLHAKVTGKAKKNGFTIEKIIYESQPKFYVTSCLFLPDGMTEKNRQYLLQRT